MMIENISVNENSRVKNFHKRDKFDDEYYPNELTIKTIEEAERGIGMSRTFDSVEELMKDLMDDA